jgi:hypothetical protein
MISKMFRFRRVFLVAAMALTSAAQAAAPAWRDLPDWTGQWVAISGDKPAVPYTPEWASKQQQAAKDLSAGKRQDPSRTCGLYFGNPWMLSVSDLHEWIVRPDGVWHNIENTGITSRIYTDGRAHLGEDDLFPTYTGDSVGHWEGDTLVFETIGLHEGAWLGPGALIHSDQLKLTHRMRKNAANELEIEVTAEDSVAFTAPWRFVQRYAKQPKGTVVREYACKILRTGD